MKQIKTIVTDLMEGKIFDQKVNEAIENGWVLIRRDVLVPHGQHRLSFLYAELERELKAEAETDEPKEHECGNCAYYGTAVYDYPCTNCVDGNKWEPMP